MSIENRYLLNGREICILSRKRRSFSIAELDNPTILRVGESEGDIKNITSGESHPTSSQPSIRVNLPDVDADVDAEVVTTED